MEPREKQIAIKDINFFQFFDIKTLDPESDPHRPNILEPDPH